MTFKRFTRRFAKVHKVHKVQEVEISDGFDVAIVCQSGDDRASEKHVICRLLADSRPVTPIWRVSGHRGGDRGRGSQNFRRAALRESMTHQ